LPDNAIYHFCEQAKKHGVDIFRVFDALNDIDQLEVGIKAVLKAGGVVEGTVCISGDLLVCSFLVFFLFLSVSCLPVPSWPSFMANIHFPA
jgi:pyruvate carboxylase